MHDQVPRKEHPGYFVAAANDHEWDFGNELGKKDQPRCLASSHPWERAQEDQGKGLARRETVLNRHLWYCCSQPRRTYGSSIMILSACAQFEK